MDAPSQEIRTLCRSSSYLRRRGHRLRRRPLAVLVSALFAAVLMLPAPARAQAADVYLDGAESWTGSDCVGDVPIVVGSDARAQSDIYSAVTLAGVVGTDCVILAGPRDAAMPASQRARLDAAADGGYVLGGASAVPDSKVAERELTRISGADRWATAQLVGNEARSLAGGTEPEPANKPDAEPVSPGDVRAPGVYLDGAEPWIASDCAGDVPIVVGSDAKAQSDIYSAVTLAGVVGTDCVILAGPRDAAMPASQQARLAAADDGGYVLGGRAAVPTAKIAGRDMTRFGGATRWATAQLVGRRASGDTTAGSSTHNETTGSGDASDSIEITPIGRGVSVTSQNQIIVELEPDDVVAANPFDLAGRSLVFTPDGRGGYSRAVGPLDWDPEDRGERPDRPAEIDLKHFRFDFSGREWGSFFLHRTGLITFGQEFPPERTPARFGTMGMIAEAMAEIPTISALYKPYLWGNVYVSDLPDRVVITTYAWDPQMAVYGRRPQETFDYQVVLHSDGRVAFNYGRDPADADEAFRDGIVGLFPTAPTTEELPRSPDRVADLSQPDSRFSAVQTEVFRYPAIRDRGEGVADVSCRIIEVLGDEFDFFAFNSQSRVDQQEHGPAHGFGGFYRGNIQDEVQGIGLRGNYRTPCESRLKNSWGFPVWMKARTVVNEAYADDGHRTPYDEGLTYFAHEIAHTWLAHASYLANGERIPMQSDGSHWALELHAPAAFPWHGPVNGSIMGGASWREDSDGTFSPTVGWWTKAGGLSWLDLYLMGLATPEEVPDMFILRNLKQVTSDRRGPYTGEKEIVTVEQVIAAVGPRNPPAEQAPKAFNVGFVYFLFPGEAEDTELLRNHADYRDRALDHWRHITGGRGQLTTELP